RGELDEAQRLLERGGERFPHDARIARARAGSDLRQGQPKKALARLEEALRSLPEQPEELVELAELLLEAGSPVQARGVTSSLPTCRKCDRAWACFFSPAPCDNRRHSATGWNWIA